MNKNLKPSEFEKQGPHEFGGYGLGRAWERLRFVMRTGLNPATTPDLDAPADKFPQEQREASDG